MRALATGAQATGGRSYSYMQPPFTQHLFGTTAGFLGGVAFAPNGDVWADNCVGDSGSLHRFAQGATYQTNGTTLHTETVVPSNAGCGLTNHPDGYLYSNTDQGVARLDAGTGAPITTLGSPGNVLGITVDPQTNDVVYVGADCRFTAACTIIRLNPTTGASSTFAVLNASDAQFVDGLAFDPSGAYLFLSNRAPTYRLTVLNRSGAIVQHVAMGDEPDGISFHSTAPQFVATSDTDGNITRFDFPHNDFTQTPTQSTFASGGYRGDLSQVGPDTCIYLTQDGTTYDDGSTASQDSIVRVCPGFAPPPGIAPTPTPAGGTIPWHPHQQVRFAAGLGASVDLADGHVDVGAADMSIPGRGPQLALNRTWDSLLAQRGVTTTAGAGWQSSLTPQMGGVLTATVSYTDGSGAAWNFVYGGDPSATGPYTTYTSPPGLPWQLTASSAGYTLTNFLTGATRTFDPSGRLSATADSYGASDAMVDDGTDQAGGALVDSGGRTIAYSYTNGVVGEEVSPLWQSSGGTQGQHVTAAYSGTLLTAHTLGAGTADAATTTFGYSGTQLVTVTTGMGHQWLLGYDAQGRVAAITNTDTTPADVTQFLYTPGQTVAIEGFGQPHQRATIYALDGQGQATSVQDAAGDTTTYTYDAQHDVTSRADANSAPGHDTTTHYAYTYAGPTGNYGLLTTRTQPAIGASGPLVTRYAYDAHNNLTQVTSPKGNVTYYGYDDAHSVVTTTQELGPDGCVPIVRPAATATPTPQPQVGAYRSFVKPYAVCVPGYAWRGRLNSYDAYGQLVATTGGRGLTVTGDPSSMPAVTVDPAQAVAHTQSYAYTAQGDLTQETTPPITTISHGVTATGSVTTTIGYDDDGDPIATTSPNGNRVVFAYDHLGRLVGTTRRGVALVPGLPSVTAITTGVGYDGDGNVITTTDGAGDLTRHDYDALGRVVKTTNPAGATTLYTYSGPVLTDIQDTTGQTTHYDYDGVDRLIGVTDPLQARTTYGYDPVGNVTSITTPLDHGATVETRTYDALNHLATDTMAGTGEISQTKAQVTTYTYDGDGNVVQGQAPNGDATYHFYDAADRLTGRALYPAPPATPDTVPPASSSEAFTYDPEGNLTDRIDYNERDHALTADADNRLTRQVDSFANGPTAAPIATDLGYDPDGNVVSLTQQGDGVAATSAIVYNAAGWVLSQDDAAGQGVTYNAYDRAGRMAGQSLGVGPGGYTALGITAGQVNVYDREGRATRVYEGAQGATPQVIASNFTYTAADLPDTATLPGNIRETRGYDPDNRLGYLYAAGPAYSSLIAPATLSRRYVYGYDPQGHTTGITASIAGSNDTVDGGVWYINHDALGQMRTQTSPNYGYYTTTYDGNGNITGWKAQDARITVVRATYTYTPSAAQASAWLPNELVDARYDGLASEDLSFGYDQSGNTTSIADTTSALGRASTTTTALGYDAAGRVTLARLPDGTAVAMAYNARGLRSAVSVTKPNQTQPDYTETILYRGDQVGQVRVTGARPFAETFLYRQDGTPLELLYQATGRPLVRYWYEVDGQGSVVALTDSSGKQVSYYGYDRWGAPVQGTTARVEAVPQPLRYRGYWYDGWYHGADYNSDGTYNATARSTDGFHTQDAPLPWYWLTTRPYAPFLERFLQPDPSAREGVRSYAYCHNDPVDCADPSGLAGVEPNPETGLMEAAGLEFRVGQTLDVNAEAGAGESAVSSGPIAADAAAADVPVQLSLPFPDEVASAQTDAGASDEGVGAEAATSAGGAAANGGGAEPRGGLYILRDPKTGEVMRTGRTSDLYSRESDHRTGTKNPATKGLNFEVVYRTDNRLEQRGLEQRLYEQYPGAPLNKQRAIDPRHPNRDRYLKAADDFLAGQP